MKSVEALIRRAAAVDPHIEIDQPGLTPDRNDPQERADYLRRMKEQTSTDGSPSDAPIPAVVTAGPPPGIKERRRSPRFRCNGSAEFRAEGSDVRMWGTLTDVSLHGCYVEMNTTFPVDTKVSLVLEAMGVRVHVPGSVRVSYPFLGMGICFSEIEPGQQLQLEQLLSVLSGQSAAPNPEMVKDNGLRDALAGADPHAFLDGVRLFFESNRLLSREECREIAKKAHRI